MALMLFLNSQRDRKDEKLESQEELSPALLRLLPSPGVAVDARSCGAELFEDLPVAHDYGCVVRDGQQSRRANREELSRW